MTNDDGWDALGIKAMQDVLVSEGHKVVVVAPLHDESGSSVSLTTSSSLRVTQPGNTDDTYAVDGTPADSVNVALTGLFDSSPSLVISGINSGYNVGDDLNYSGTVGAAVVAALHGVPSIAVSTAAPAAGDDSSKRYRAVALFISRLLVELDDANSDVWPMGTVLNINYPATTTVATAPRGVLFTQVADARSMMADYDMAGKGIYERRYVPDDIPPKGTDIAAVADGFVSVSAFSANRGALSQDYAKVGSLVAAFKP
ncbi:MAG: 5'/3'-nucleotidase SurE [Lacisediminihabitans sp.]